MGECGSLELWRWSGVFSGMLHEMAEDVGCYDTTFRSGDGYGGGMDGVLLYLVVGCGGGLRVDSVAIVEWMGRPGV